MGSKVTSRGRVSDTERANQQKTLARKEGNKMRYSKHEEEDCRENVKNKGGEEDRQ